MYAILINYHYYAGTLGQPSDKYALDAYDDVLLFDSQEEAQEHIDSLSDDGPYYLSHGEYAAPSYEIVDMDNRPADCLMVYKPGDKWGDRLVISEERIPAPIRDSIVGGNVDFYNSDGEIEDWTYTEEHNGATYGITFFVRSEASQMTALTDDMSNLDWDYPTYWTDASEMTVAEAESYAVEVGESVTGRAIRHAAKEGYIPGARKLGRDWLIPFAGMYHYLDNRPKPGRKTAE
jgi:hypothetical protein